MLTGRLHNKASLLKTLKAFQEQKKVFVLAMQDVFHDKIVKDQEKLPCCSPASKRYPVFSVKTNG